MTDITWPFAPLFKYAWPGGYQVFALVDDGEILCADCVNDPTNPVHIGDDMKDGWLIVGIGNTSETDEAGYCAHCGNVVE